MRLSSLIIAAALAGLAPAALAGGVPKLSKSEARNLFLVAGFPLQGTQITNRCGQPANPGVTFVDLNGDGVPEAAFVDAGPCYPGGHWISVLRRAAPGAWLPVFEGPGTAQPVAHRTNGWYDLKYASNGATLILQFTGSVYAAATPPAAAPASGPRDVLPGDVPTAAQDAAIHRVFAKTFAEVQRIEHHALDYRVGEADLNGDGRPDLFVHLDDMMWCGSSGCSGFVLMATPAGYAASAFDLPNFYSTIHILPESHGGMHDLRFDDAHYIFRWNGRAYR